jgi:hypothetical protein
MDVQVCRAICPGSGSSQAIGLGGYEVRGHSPAPACSAAVVEDPRPCFESNTVPTALLAARSRERPAPLSH